MPEINVLTAILENMTISIKLTENKLDLNQFYDSLSDPKCGGTVVFQGTVRNIFYPDKKSLENTYVLFTKNDSSDKKLCCVLFCSVC